MSIITHPYAFRSRFLLSAGIVSLITVAISEPAHATSTRSFAGLSYFQKRSKNASELALDASQKTPLLDEIPGYAAGVAQQIWLDQQHPIYFKVKTDTYPFIIKSIDGSSITTQIAAGLDTKIGVGHTESYDADQDTHNDIAVSLNAINSDVVQLTIFKLPLETVQSAAVSMAPFDLFKWGFVITLALAIATLIIRTRPGARII